MKKLILIPLVLLGLKFTPNLVVKAGLISYYLYNSSLEAQTPLTKEDADTYYKPVSYIPALSTIQIDGTPYISVDGQYNAENSVYTWNMIQSKPDFMGIAYNALSSQLIEDSPLVHFEVQELAISGNSLSIKTGTVVINTIELPPSISSETQSLSITGLNLSIKSGATTINTIAIPNQTTNLSAVAFSGDYGSLSGTPTIPSSQVNSDWSSGSGISQILNKPTTLSGYGITNAYPLTGNPSGFLTSIPAQSFSSLTGKPTTLAGYGITDSQSSLSGTGFVKISGTTISYDNNTYLTSEVDGSITNEIELPSQSGNAGRTLSTNGSSVSWGKRQESYSGTSNGSGNYTVTFGTAYSVAPNIVIGLKGSTNEQGYDSVTISTTGFTIHIYQRTYALGLAQTPTNVSGATIDVLITEK